MSDSQNDPSTPATPPPPAPPAAAPPPPAPPAATPPPPPMPVAAPPAPPASVPPPPVGQPIGQQPSQQPYQPGYPPAYGAAPPPGARSMGKFVTGIILTVVGGLWALVGLGGVALVVRTFADNPGYATGRFIGGLIIPAALLVVGIILIRRSKR
jgi:hypothetical protein